ncbi:very short patch repair endonuclease [Isoptericola sp. AK164]|uniref:very short patch repair endonuclease n=1 Tax=Isoptericola sp. AK164 TaxID=3024246 RepID=UPI0024185814|nr:very short patch repair endonuclease [Isoptericola sp. AK164]
MTSAPRPQHVPAHPGSSSRTVSRRMSRAKRRDTAPEFSLRLRLHALGLRYRVAYPVPGQRRRSIDIAFTRARLAVFVDGCFWHGCEEHGIMPTANSEWWRTKIGANKSRDRDTDRVLMQQGWMVLRVWEHEEPATAVDRIAATYHSRMNPVTVRRKLSN